MGNTLSNSWEPRSLSETRKCPRGAGNRGGRGNAGRGEALLGETGVNRPPVSKKRVVQISLREIDEYFFHRVTKDSAENESNEYKIDARELVDDYDAVDTVKVWGSGVLRSSLTIIADEFSQPALERIESNGGKAVELGGVDGVERDSPVTLASGGEIEIQESPRTDVKVCDEDVLEVEWTDVYSDLYDVIDETIERSGVRELNQTQRVFVSLALAAAFLPVIEKPVGYITVTGVIYAILSDMRRHQR